MHLGIQRQEVISGFWTKCGDSFNLQELISGTVPSSLLLHSHAGVGAADQIVIEKTKSDGSWSQNCCAVNSSGSGTDWPAAVRCPARAGPGGQTFITHLKLNWTGICSHPGLCNCARSRVTHYLSGQYICNKITSIFANSLPSFTPTPTYAVYFHTYSAVNVRISCLKSMGLLWEIQPRREQGKWGEVFRGQQGNKTLTYFKIKQNKIRKTHSTTTSGH